MFGDKCTVCEVGVLERLYPSGRRCNETICWTCESLWQEDPVRATRFDTIYDMDVPVVERDAVLAEIRGLARAFLAKT